MITEHDLQEAIAECEGQRNPTSNTCLKLAAYYTIKDKMFPREDQDRPVAAEVYSRAQGPVWSGKVDYSGETEFGRAISGRDLKDVMSVMDELMSTLQVVSPRIYAGVIRQLSESN